MKKNAQVWIETVLYIIIGLALIGLTLTIINPKINQAKDNILMQQSMDSLNIFDERIREVIDRGPGNTRVISEFNLRKGKLIISPVNDTITLIVTDLSKPYSEPGLEIPIGNIKMVSIEGQSSSTTFLKLDFREVANITYKGIDIQNFEFSSTPQPYSFTLKNVGKSDPYNFDELLVVDISEGKIAQI